MVQLTAELEKATRSRLTAERESLALNEKLSRVSQQKQYLMKTTEMYEADKRELEQEVGGYSYTQAILIGGYSYTHFMWWPH